MLYGPLEPEPLRILWLSSHSPWGGAEGRPKKDYKGLTALLPFSQLHSVLMRFGQIFQERNSPKRIMLFKNRLVNILKCSRGLYFLEFPKSFFAFFELSVNAIGRDLLGHGG